MLENIEELDFGLDIELENELDLVLEDELKGEELLRTDEPELSETLCFDELPTVEELKALELL